MELGQRESKGILTVLLNEAWQFYGTKGKNNRNKGKQIKSEWWRFLFPSYPVYIEELIHSQKWKVMGGKKYQLLLASFLMICHGRNSDISDK